ncbi:MAG TPA: hypothetical protein VM582_07620, partial [Candidatus Thermoplasmatota archaeon]|nr:hypothetical protein [Candidatus Thermoplasmatota archaeon]
MRRILASAIAFMMISTLGAGVASAGAHERIVDEWAAALLTRDAAVIEATPWGYAHVAPHERATVARAVLDRVLEEDPEAAALFVDPSLGEAERAARYAEAVEILSLLMFDRAALMARLAAEAEAAYEPPEADPGAPEVGLANERLVDAARRDVERLATVPAAIAEAARAAAEESLPPLEGPRPIDAGPLAGFAALLPADIRFAVCWRSAGDEGCADIVPLAPMPLDVTGEGIPDVLASLNVVSEPSDALDLVGAGAVAPQLAFRVERLPGDAPLQALIVGVFALE